MSSPVKNPKDNQPSKKKPYSAYARFSGLGVQMGMVIFLGVWGGMRLDERLGTDPGFTVGLSLFAVIASMYLVFRELGD